MGLGNRPGFTAMTGAERSGDDARERIKRHQFSLRQPLKGNGLTAPDQQAQHEPQRHEQRRRDGGVREHQRVRPPGRA